MLQLSISLRESEQNADSVKEKILVRIGRLQIGNISDRKDQYKINNDGHFHYFELSSYRISYYAYEGEIIIVRVRHVRMKPLDY